MSLPLSVAPDSGGPGAALRAAFVEGWGLRFPNPGAAPPSPPAGQALLLPAFWRVLQTLGDPALPRPWQPLWAHPTPVGVCAPAALVVLTHTGEGVVGLDIDPDDHGLRAAWWTTPDRLGRLAVDIGDFAALIGRGPKALEQACDGPWKPAFPVEPDALPFDPISRVWREDWPAGSRAFVLPQAGCAVPTHGWFKRHPTRPLVALGPG